MSPYSGYVYSANEYESYYPNFIYKGILIAGPIKQGNNCGMTDDTIKIQLIGLCKALCAYFN